MLVILSFTSLSSPKVKTIMKVGLEFRGLSADEAFLLLQFAREHLPMAHEGAGLLLDDSDPKPKPQRKRRTKVEMAEARADGEAGDPSPEPPPAEEQAEELRSQGVDDPPTPRRRKRGDDVDPSSSAPVAGCKKQRTTAASSVEPAQTDDTSPKRGKRRKKADEDEISDEDVAKAASEGAQQHTPKVVSGILAEFDVDNVAELSQEQRREFMKALDDYEAF